MLKTTLVLLGQSGKSIKHATSIRASNLKAFVQQRKLSTKKKKLPLNGRRYLQMMYSIRGE